MPPRIEYARPGRKGVTMIMGIGADGTEDDDLASATQTGGWIALGVWGVGMLTDKKALKSAGLWGGVALLVVSALGKRS